MPPSRRHGGSFITKKKAGESGTLRHYSSGIWVNVKKNLDKEGNISHWKMAQKCRIGGMGQCGRKAVSRQCRDVARQQTSVKGHKNFSGCMPGKFFVFAALTLDPG